MTPIARTAVLWLVAACGNAPPPATAPSPAPAPAPTPPPAIDLAQLGAPCADGPPCAAPATCVAYYGIAGASGPQFKSCEVSCADEPTTCPAGTTCITIADGPGAVCRRGGR
jgi:hypothetical protein